MTLKLSIFHRNLVYNLNQKQKFAISLIKLITTILHSKNFLVDLVNWKILVAEPWALVVSLAQACFFIPELAAPAALPAFPAFSLP